MKRILSDPVRDRRRPASSAARSSTCTRSRKAKPVVFQTETAEIADITKKTVATGSIVPRREVEVKPKVTGVLSELYVEPGKKVKMAIRSARSRSSPTRCRSTRPRPACAPRRSRSTTPSASSRATRSSTSRASSPMPSCTISGPSSRSRQQELTTSGSNLQLVKEGATRGQGKSSTLIVTATADGHGDRRAGQGRLLGDPGQQLQPGHHGRRRSRTWTT